MDPSPRPDGPHGGSTLAALSSITETEQNPAAMDMVRELVEGRLQVHEKTAWMLRSLLNS